MLNTAWKCSIDDADSIRHNWIRPLLYLPIEEPPTELQLWDLALEEWLFNYWDKNGWSNFLEEAIEWWSELDIQYDSELFFL